MIIELLYTAIYLGVATLFYKKFISWMEQLGRGQPPGFSLIMVACIAALTLPTIIVHAMGYLLYFLIITAILL